MASFPLLKFRNYFISSGGFVFKIENRKEVPIPAFRTKKSKDIFIIIENKSYNLLHLMIQHFIGDLKFTDRVRFTPSKDFRIPLITIKIKQALGINGLSKEDETIMYNFRCDVKAGSANGRSQQKITPVDVFRTLKIHSFKCVYCLCELPEKNWHLDHFSSLSKGGKNIIENIVPACDVCNLMKGAMDGNQFFVRCKKVFDNYMFRTSEILKTHLEPEKSVVC